jgi:hypothetical protein
MIEILIHIMPSEIDQLEQTLIGLKKSNNYIENEEFLVEVCLNANLTDWNKSKLDLNFFENKLNEFKKLTSTWAKTRFWTSKNNEVLGCTDLHRLSGRLYNPNAFIWLDVDIVFSDSLLYHIVEAHKQLSKSEKYFVITPETTRIWDNTWDVITNENCLKEEASKENYFNRDPYTTTGLVGEVNVSKINTFKFASGWFTLLSNDLIKKVDIPNRMGPYYMDDTFIMVCCIYGQQKGFNASQFVINNEVIIENNKFRYNPYKDYIVTINKKDEFMDIAKNNFNESVQEYLNKL